jgi:hypothetical protein
MKIADIDYSLQAGDVFIWQYANALRLNQILQNEINYYGENISQFITDWETDVFNLLTANSFGLDLWGKILDAPRPLVSPQNYIIDTETTLRLYNPNTDSWHAIWLSNNIPTLNIQKNPIQPTLSNYGKIQISDIAYRRCLIAKLYLLHSNASINDINKILDKIYNFGVPENQRRVVYIEDNFNMTMNVNFNFVPTDIDLTIITLDTFSPRPMGVKFTYGVSSIGANTFSFSEMDLGTWGNNENSIDPEQVKLGLGTFYNL